MAFDIVGVVRILIYLFLGLFSVKLLFDYIIQKRNSKSISEDMLRIQISGKANVKDLSLTHLWLSDNGSKKVDAGKIVSFVKIKDKGKEINNCIVVKERKLEPFKFYLVDDKTIINKHITGDIILNSWNFRLDDNNNFYVKNKQEVILIEPLKERAMVGVDTLKKLAPLVHSSINANPIHRIRLRESRLIR